MKSPIEDADLSLDESSEDDFVLIEENAQHEPSQPDGGKSTEIQLPSCRCGKTFSSASEFTKHRNQHTKPYKCLANGCEQAFSQRQQLVRHVQARHERPDKYFHCTTEGCKYAKINAFASPGLRFIRGDHLKTHIKDYGHYGPHSPRDRKKRQEPEITGSLQIKIVIEEWSDEGQRLVKQEILETPKTKLWHEDTIGASYLVNCSDGEVYHCDIYHCYYHFMPPGDLPSIGFRTLDHLELHRRLAGHRFLPDASRDLTAMGAIFSTDSLTVAGSLMEPYRIVDHNVDRTKAKENNSMDIFSEIQPSHFITYDNPTNNHDRNGEFEQYDIEVGSTLPDPKKRKICSWPGCNSTFGRQADLQRHEKVHQGAGKLLCTRCGKAFFRRDKLLAHLRKKCPVSLPQSPVTSTYIENVQRGLLQNENDLPPNFGFLWSIDALETLYDEKQGPRYLPIGGSRGNEIARLWFPPNRSNQFKRKAGNLYRWRMGISERADPSQPKKKYQEASIFFQDLQDNFIVALTDCTRHNVKDEDVGWSQIGFNHNAGNLSEVDIAAQNFRLAAPATGSTWMPQVLPEVYNYQSKGPRNKDKFFGPRGGLCGRLSILIGMGAFSAEEADAEATVSKCFGLRKWHGHQFDAGVGRYQDRGVLVSIYLDPDVEGVTDAHLRLFERGEYGPIFSAADKSSYTYVMTGGYTANSWNVPRSESAASTRLSYTTVSQAPQPSGLSIYSFEPRAFLPSGHPMLQPRNSTEGGNEGNSDSEDEN